MKVLVTGLNGQIARALAERNQDRFQLVFQGRPELDLEIPGSAARVIAEARPNVVINAAAYTLVDQAEDEPQRAMRVNGEAAGEVAAAAAALSVPIIQISTDYVFDGTLSGFYDETAQPAPINAYGRSKLAGEQAVRAANANHAIIRTSWVYSPFGQNFVKSIMSAAKVRDVLTVVDDQQGTPTSALGFADAVFAMLARWEEKPGLGAGETYHLAGNGAASWCAFASEIMSECAVRGLPTAKIEAIASEDWPTKAKRPQNSRLSSRKFAEKFGFEMVPVQRALQDVIGRIDPNRAV